VFGGSHDEQAYRRQLDEPEGDEILPLIVRRGIGTLLAPADKSPVKGQHQRQSDQTEFRKEI
jgi:hypothetical protein